MAAKRLLEGMTSSIIFGHIKQEREMRYERLTHTHIVGPSTYREHVPGAGGTHGEGVSSHLRRG